VGSSILEVQASHPQEMEVVVRKVFEEETWPQIRAALELSSDKRARTLFVKGLERLRSLVEERLGTRSFEQLLGL